jgi:tetratricopeptide (TPR) repeat protein
LAKNDPAQLSVEELLYAATLTNDNAEKKAIYQKAAELYNDYRAYNGLGQVYFEEGNIAEARRNFAKALELNPNDPDLNYNAGVAAMADGDLGKAEEYFGKAGGTKANLDAALGTLYTQKGDYEAAKKVDALYGKWRNDVTSRTLRAVASSTPLPKGHGDLIDRQELLKSTLCKTFGLRSVDIENAPTIVEADKE